MGSPSPTLLQTALTTTPRAQLKTMAPIVHNYSIPSPVSVERPSPSPMEMDPPRPILQLKEKVTVYIMFTDKGGSFHGRRNDRDVVMMREGIKRHPMIEMIGEGPGANQRE